MAGGPDKQDLLDRAGDIAQLVADKALECERERRIVDEVFEPINAADLIRVTVPTEYGGLGLDPMTACEVIETLARADGSTGWVAMILNGGLMLQWLEPDVARELTKGEPFVLAGMFGPLGRAEANGSGYTVSGRWPFNSGSVHANWMLGGVMTFDDGELRTREPGMPDWRFAFFPASEAEIHDTWHAAGLRATSSHDVSVESITVDDALVPAPIFEPCRYDGTIGRWSFMAQLAGMMAGVPLGLARRAIDEARDVAVARGRGGRPPMIENADVQNALVRSEAALRSARSYMYDAMSTAWDTALGGDQLSIAERLDIRLACTYAGSVGVEIVDRCFRIGGGGALYEHSPLQRCWRDMHALTHHIFFSDDQMRDFGQVALGRVDESIFL